MKNNSENNGIWVIAVAIIVVALPAVISIVSSLSKEISKKQCNSNEIYVESSNTCRTKTVSERFSEECKDGIFVDGAKYTCADLKNENLEEAYLRGKKIVKHGGSIYELGTYSEIQAGKNAGEYCLSASDTWYHIGETRCVAFNPEYFAYQGNNYFIDEKKDYKNGFVVYMYGNYGWNWFLNAYKDKGMLLVCGKITTYQGHPQIKTTPASITVNPKASSDHLAPVYRYSCK